MSTKNGIRKFYVHRFLIYENPNILPPLTKQADAVIPPKAFLEKLYSTTIRIRNNKIKMTTIVQRIILIIFFRLSILPSPLQPISQIFSPVHYTFF